MVPGSDTTLLVRSRSVGPVGGCVGQLDTLVRAAVEKQTIALLVAGPTAAAAPTFTGMVIVALAPLLIAVDELQSIVVAPTVVVHDHVPGAAAAPGAARVKPAGRASRTCIAPDVTLGPWFVTVNV